VKIYNFGLTRPLSFIFLAATPQNGDYKYAYLTYSYKIIY